MSKQQSTSLWNEQNIRLALCNALTEILNRNGIPVPKVSGSLRPMEELGGFDSLALVETISILSRLLGVDVDPKLVLDRVNGQSLSIDEMTGRLVKTYLRG